MNETGNRDIPVRDCRFDVSPVNYPDLDMVKLGRMDWVV